jgi:hypothetical protein
MFNADNDNNPENKTKIYHYTAPEYVDEIIQSGFIELELHRYFAELQRAANDNIREARFFCNEFKSTGRYVWFTTESSSPTAGPLCTVRFSFIAEDIGAEKWITVKKNQIRKMGGRAFDAINRLEETALKEGDDPTKWWICRTRVPVANDNFDSSYRLPAPPYSIDDCATFSDLIKDWRRRQFARGYDALVRSTAKR